jgi:hypothetical protein
MNVAAPLSAALVRRRTRGVLCRARPQRPAALLPVLRHHAVESVGDHPRMLGARRLWCLLWLRCLIGQTQSFLEQSPLSAVRLWLIGNGHEQFAV